jgi:gluconolactonase
MDVHLIAEGLQFPEGPVAMADGSVLVVEIKRQTLTRVHPDGKLEVVAELGGGPNGAAIGPDGAVYITNNGGFGWVENEGLTFPHGTAADYTSGSIQRVDLQSGAVTTLYAECNGLPLNGPNDLVFDGQGGFWFTDLGKNNDLWMHHGRLFYARADGSRIVCVREGMVTPNGCGLSPDGKTVWVAETLTSRVWGFPIAGPGELAAAPAGVFTAGHVLGPLPGYQLLDSLAVEASGKVCAATLVNGGITIFDPAGGTEHVAFPDPLTTNIAFGGADMQDAFVTASSTGKLYKTRWARPGLKLAYNG